MPQQPSAKILTTAVESVVIDRIGLELMLVHVLQLCRSMEVNPNVDSAKHGC